MSRLGGLFFDKVRPKEGQTKMRIRDIRIARVISLAVAVSLAACTPSPSTSVRQDHHASSVMVGHQDESRAVVERLSPRQITSVPVIRPTKPIVTTGMVSVGGDIFCPAPITMQSVKQWPNVGSMPSVKKHDGIRDLRYLPASVKTKALALFASGAQTKAWMANGQRICSMTYGANSVWDNIQASWHDRTRQYVEYVVVEDGDWNYVVGIPPRPANPEGVNVDFRGCNNAFFFAMKKGADVRRVLSPFI